MSKQNESVAVPSMNSYLSNPTTHLLEHQVKVFIGLGANLDSPQAKLNSAINELAALPETQLVAQSSIYLSPPMGPQDQNDYHNAVVAIQTRLMPLALLDQLQNIENLHGRVRKAQRWGPRTLDLDILLYHDKTIENSRLTIPHYGLEQRIFVLQPLFEIAPELVLPNGKSIKTLLQSIDNQRIQKL
ncbi:2-amino-4-hydroxy-6-hydroxymethyldihydropteridine diphosphokinase [Aliikangiella maris]|uniref:2-amino-4-hydroxy-6-hydroxymethyldihydropteridine diphosphokinase n=2 Tax=Aliikangiella maris TaxID=3162458 RepID=A0ABV2BRY8_9GAMM